MLLQIFTKSMWTTQWWLQCFAWAQAWKLRLLAWAQHNNNVVIHTVSNTEASHIVGNRNGVSWRHMTFVNLAMVIQEEGC